MRKYAVAACAWLISSAVFAQFEEFTAASDNLALAINDLNAQLNRSSEDVDHDIQQMVEATNELSGAIERTRNDVNDYAPKFRDIGEDAVGTLQDMYALADEETPKVRAALETGANALKTMAGVGTFAKDNTVKLSVSAGLVIASGVAAGVIIGQMLSSHVFTLNTKHNIFCMTYRGGRSIYQAVRSMESSL